MKWRYLLFLFLPIIHGCQSLDVQIAKADWADLEHWDRDKNMSLDLGEFTKGYSSKDFFDRWNSHSREIDDSVFLQALFAHLDRNHNSSLDSNEYKSRRILWTFPRTQELMTWDLNQNWTIEREEFMKNARDEHVAQAFDIIADGRITEPEMAEGMFDVCDKDYNGKVTAMEFYLWEVYRR